MYACYECGRKFRTIRAAERAVNNGCPKCGAVDIDLDDTIPPSRRYPNMPVPYVGYMLEPAPSRESDE